MRRNREPVHAVPAEHISALRLTLNCALVVTWLASGWMARAAHAAQVCEASGPAMLAVYLTGREIGDTVHRQVLQAMPTQDAKVNAATALADLDRAMAALETQVWGFYWVSLYSRRLHEVLEQLDSKPPGPVTSYYNRWDASQSATSSSLLRNTAGAASAALARAIDLAPANAANVRKYLDQIGAELRGCASE